MYIFIIKEDLEKTKGLLQKLNNNFYQIRLNIEEIKQLLDYTESLFRKGKTTEEYWKIYKLYSSSADLTYVEFKYYRRPSGYPYDYSPDYYFGEELIELSKLIDKEIFYIWEQHIDIGYELFKGGQCVNSVIVDTHGPGIKVNGKDVEIPKKVRFFGIIEKYEHGKVVEENSEIPKQIRESVNYKYLKKLSSECLVFINKDIPDFASLMKRINKG
jgi:hypothetical protein